MLSVTRFSVTVGDSLIHLIQRTAVTGTWRYGVFSAVRPIRVNHLNHLRTAANSGFRFKTALSGCFTNNVCITDSGDSPDSPVFRVTSNRKSAESPESLESPESVNHLWGVGMARRKRGIFDPDYRTKGWNRSRYAPKNSSVGITQTAGMIALILTGPLFYLLYLNPTIEIMGIALVTLFFVWGFTARFIIKREWARIQREMAAEETSNQRDANATRQRQANKDLDLNNLTPSDFEHEVAWLLNTLSNFKAVVVGGSGDDGVDVELYQSGRMVGIVQCKYYDAKRALQPAHVREVAGTKKAAGARLGYLFTTARVTSRTRKTAESLGVKVFDGDQIVKMRQKARAKAQR